MLISGSGTTSSPVAPWPEAAVDRLVHHCHFIGIKGESYRQKEAAARISSDPCDPPT